MATREQFLKYDNSGNILKQSWVIEDPDGAIAIVDDASTPEEAWSIFGDSYPDLKEKASNPMYGMTIQPYEGYSKRVSELQNKLLKEKEARGFRYEDTQDVGEALADLAFPIGSSLARQGSSPEKILYGTAADAALNTLPIAGGQLLGRAFEKPAYNILARGGVEGLLGGLSSGVQEYATTGEVTPLGVGIGVVAPTIFEAGGAFAKRGGKASAEKAIESVIKTPTRQVNKPSASYALDKNLVPFVGGVDEMSSRVGERLQFLGDIRDKMFSGEGIYAKAKVNPRGVSSMAKESIESDPGMIGSDIQSAKRIIEKELKYMTNESGSWMPASEALRLKTAMYNKAKASVTPRGKMTATSKAYEAIGKALDTYLTNIAPEAKATSQLMNPLMAWKQSIESAGPRINRNLGISMGDLLAAGVFSDPMAKLGSVGGRRMTATIGGGRLLYEGGKAAERLSPYAAQAARLYGLQGESLADNFQ